MVNTNQPVMPWEYYIDPATGNAIANFNGLIYNNGSPFSPGGGGDVTGPGSSVAGNFPGFADGTGKNLDDSGFSSASFDPAGSAAAAQAAAEAASDPVGSAAAAQANAEAYADANKIAGAGAVTDGNMVVFNGTSGLDVKDGGPAPVETDGTFVPTITFGGGSVGIVYNAQQGNYTQLGGIVIFTLLLSLISKGTSTGIAIIHGLPVSSRNVSPNQYAGGCYAIDQGSMDPSVTGIVTGEIQSSDNSFLLVAIDGGTTFLNDSHFASGSTLAMTGSYLT